MLADTQRRSVARGQLRPELVVGGGFIDHILNFIAHALPDWCLDSVRSAESAEVRLNDQLAVALDDAARQRFDAIAFKTETPDEISSNRALDLTVRPSNIVIVLSGRPVSRYEVLLPIECKRLPTPPGSRRDAREYVFSRFSTTGGIHRFKTGRHGARHQRAAMIGYVQEGGYAGWRQTINRWVTELAASDPTWQLGEVLVALTDAPVHRHRSVHPRLIPGRPAEPITLDHLWIRPHAERGV